MADDIYTHDFRFEVGGSFIRGEVEFNTDDKMSFDIKSWSKPLSKTVLDKFSKWMDYLKMLHGDGNKIKVIGVKKKKDNKWKTIKEIKDIKKV